MREVLFPGSARMVPKFAVDFVELESDRPNPVRDLVVTPYPALHTPETAPTILRVAVAGKVVTYTGDTEWTDARSTSSSPTWRPKCSRRRRRFRGAPRTTAWS